MSQSLSPLLMYYMGRRFLAYFLLIFLSLACVVLFLDAVELIRRLVKYDNFTVWRMLTMTLLKSPQALMQIMPFTILIAAAFTFWRLTRTSELVAIRATGVSVWQFLCMPILIAVMLAIFKMTTLSPLSVVLLKNYEEREAKYLSAGDSTVNLVRTGLWLRQKMTDNQFAIIHAQTVAIPEWSFNPATAFFFDTENHLKYRIDSVSAQIKNKKWVFQKAWLNTTDTQQEAFLPRYYDSLELSTEISVKDIQSRFVSVRTISFWNLLEYAKILRETGFVANPLLAYYYSMMAEPFLNVALVLMAAALALRAPRQQRNWWLVGGTVATGFIVFFMGDFLKALGISDRLPLVIAAFAPATISLLLGLTALLYLEDG